MRLSELKPANGAVKKSKRIARGTGSGHGGTSTRGHKGAKSRSGFKNKRNFEGGQMPLQMRLPKVGFKSPNKVVSAVLNLKRLQDISLKYNTTSISLEFLVGAGIVDKNDHVKILATGKLASPLNITAHAASQSAIAAVESAGGSLTIVK
jgi:large subunit ribosomal protein L15